MKRNNLIIGKLLYAIVFLVFFPVGIWFWAKFTQDVVPFPAIESKLVGSSLVIFGGLLMLWGMYALNVYGKGLPMNAYPPPVFVTKGPYRLFRHPIYWGFGLLMVGYFIYTGSASGIWMVSPLVVLGMVVLVLGHESIDLKKRFPGQYNRTVLDYPEDQSGAPDLRDHLTSLFWIFSFLVLGNFVVEILYGTMPPLFGEPLHILPVLANPDLTFLSLIYILIVPFMLKRKDTMREWEISGFIALAIAVFIAVLYPSIGAQYLQTQDAFIFTVPIFMLLISLRAMYRQSIRTAVTFTIIFLFLIVIQLINSRSAILHLTSSVLIFLLSVSYPKIWIFLRNSSEKIANSWKEWVFGKVRVINHGFYVGFGAFFGILTAGTLAGKEYAWALLIFSICGVTTAGLWAQIIEGSDKLKRPFGYYGGVVGIVFGSIAVWLMGVNVWVVIGITAVMMPWVQAIGRLRCLVNGCCHGSRVDDPNIGIRYTHYRSRVGNISGLKGELIHPTPLYSIVWLFFVGLFLFSLWAKNVSCPVIFGIYLILTSLGRFVEEAYRGEVQTPILGGLHLYQWTAIISVLVGIFMTTITAETPVLLPAFNLESFWAALLCGLFACFAMGIDFPYSNARFSRLV
jgi:protein-S-isoprenylcysteine O-methyltransferase Ste14